MFLIKPSVLKERPNSFYSTWPVLFMMIALHMPLWKIEFLSLKEKDFFIKMTTTWMTHFSVDPRRYRFIPWLDIIKPLNWINTYSWHPKDFKRTRASHCLYAFMYKYIPRNQTQIIDNESRNIACSLYTIKNNTNEVDMGVIPRCVSIT